MDIHAPEGPTRSLKEFAIHILIVTIGILIALGLEGIREAVREHHLIAETRATFRQELEVDRQHLAEEITNVRRKSDEVDGILRDYPELVKNPDELRKRVDDLRPGFYTFRATSWAAASSSGVLAYMKPEETNRFADVYFEIGTYGPLSRQALVDWTATKSFFDSRRSFSQQDAMDGEQKLRMFQFDQGVLTYLDKPLMEDLNGALARP